MAQPLEANELTLVEPSHEHDPRAIANEFILKAAEHRKASKGKSGYLLSALQVGKMTVVAHSLHLTSVGTPLCNERVVNDPENFSFVHFPSVREALKACGKGVVRHPIRTGVSAWDQILPHRVAEFPVIRAELTEAQQAIIDRLWAIQVKYGPECYIWSRHTKIYDEKGELKDELIAERFAEHLAA